MAALEFRKARQDVVQIAVHDEAQEREAHKERKEPQEERQSPYLIAVVTYPLHGSLTAQEARDLQVIGIEFLLFARLLLRHARGDRHGLLRLRALLARLRP